MASPRSKHQRCGVWWGPSSWVTEAVFSLYPHMAEEVRDLWTVLWGNESHSRGLRLHDLISFQKFHLQTPSIWGLDFNIWIGGVGTGVGVGVGVGGTTSVYGKGFSLTSTIPQSWEYNLVSFHFLLLWGYMLTIWLLGVAHPSWAFPTSNFQNRQLSIFLNLDPILDKSSLPVKNVPK